MKKQKEKETKCPNCKTSKGIIEIHKPEEKKFYWFCLNCSWIKETKRKETNEEE